jgi:hypothetical protein
MRRYLGTFTCRGLLSLLSLCTFASVAAAQKRISGISRCGKPDQQQTMPVGDRPDHSFGIVKVKCTWTKPIELAGLQTAEDEITGSSEVTGNSGNERMFVVGSMSNGDKLYARPAGKVMLKDGAPQSSSGEWTYTGGTGKLTGIKGKGTYKCAWGADGAATCDISGHYTIPKGKM